MADARKVYVTKYALTDGIRECVVDEESTASCMTPGWLRVVWPGAPNGMASFSRDNWHETLEGAHLRVSAMVAAKLKSLDRQRSKLEKLASDGAKVVEVKA